MKFHVYDSGAMTSIELRTCGHRVVHSFDTMVEVWEEIVNSCKKGERVRRQVLLEERGEFKQFLELDTDGIRREDKPVVFGQFLDPMNYSPSCLKRQNIVVLEGEQGDRFHYDNFLQYAERTLKDVDAYFADMDFEERRDSVEHYEEVFSTVLPEGWHLKNVDDTDYNVLEDRLLVRFQPFGCAFEERFHATGSILGNGHDRMWRSGEEKHYLVYSDIS